MPPVQECMMTDVILQNDIIMHSCSCIVLLASVYWPMKAGKEGMDSGDCQLIKSPAFVLIFSFPNRVRFKVCV